jgi:hypothetical protein
MLGAGRLWTARGIATAPGTPPPQRDARRPWHLTPRRPSEDPTRNSCNVARGKLPSRTKANSPPCSAPRWPVGRYPSISEVNAPSEAGAPNAWGVFGAGLALPCLGALPPGGWARRGIATGGTRPHRRSLPPGDGRAQRHVALRRRPGELHLEPGVGLLDVAGGLTRHAVRNR